MTILLEITNEPNLTYGAGLLVAAAAGAAGGLIKGIGSLFGRRRKKRAMQKAQRAQKAMERKVMNFKFNNAFKGMEGTSYEPTQADAAELASAAQMGLPQLGDPKSMQAIGYEAQGYTADQTNVAGLLRGDNTGLTNEMANMQVSTAAAEMQAAEADQALAGTLDLAAQAGTGAGGATALAAQAAKSKAGIAADIDKQVKENEVRRAQGEMQLQREQLAQQNLASQFDLGQQQFNVAAVNTARQFSANAANQAAAFEAGALNNAARFNAQAANQFALQNFQTEAQMNQFNTNALNQFARTEYGAMNQLNLANAQAANRADEFAAKTSFNADQLARQGDMSVQQFQYNRLAAMMGQRQAEASQARAANEKQRGMLLEGLSQAATGAGQAILGGSDRKLKKDIKLIGVSPSGLNIYSFRYKDIKFGKGLFQGVMSDEVPSNAVIKHADGYDLVDYSKIDVKFNKLQA